MLENERTQEIHQQRPKTKLTHRRRYERKAILLEREDKRQGRDTLSASFLRSRFRTPTSATYANMSPILNAMQVIKGPDAGPYQTAVAYLLEVRGEDGIPDAFRFLEHMQRSKISPIGPVYALIIQAAVTPKTFHGVLQRMAESSVSYDRAVLGALTCRGAKSATLDEIWVLFKQHIEAPGISPLEYEHDKGGNSEVVHAVLERAATSSTPAKTGAAFYKVLTLTAPHPSIFDANVHYNESVSPTHCFYIRMSCVPTPTFSTPFVWA